MKTKKIWIIPFIVLGLEGYAQTGYCADGVASLAGVYSSAHPVTMDGVRMTTNGYVEIDPNGQITAFEQDNEGPASVGSGCYRLATGTATNAGLQGRILTPGVSLRGDAVYQTLAGDSDTFGILTEPAPNGGIKWFFHAGRANSTVTVNGIKNVVNADNQSSYSISGPALTSPTPAQLRGMLCHTGTVDAAATTDAPAAASDTPHVRPNFGFHVPPKPLVIQADQASTTAGSPAPASSVTTTAAPANTASSPSPLAAALPFDLSKPVDPTILSKFGITPDSPKGKLLAAWANKVVNDPDIKAQFFTKNSDPSTMAAVAFSRSLAMLDGMERISLEDREALSAMSTHALDHAPADCGGTKSLPVIMSRYLAPDSISDKEFQAQLDATYDLLKQSTLTTPPPQLTATQRLQAQLAMSTSLANALKKDPAETDDVGLLAGGKQAQLSPEAWCRAFRLYRNAFNETPQPERDWVTLMEVENQKRLINTLVTILKNANAMLEKPVPPAAAPASTDYAEKVRRLVRPYVDWNGPTDHRETVIEVHCAPTGSVESVNIVTSSGDPSWDSAALMAVRQADPMPLDTNGQARPVFDITMRPDGRG